MWAVSTHVKVADVGRPLLCAQPVFAVLQQPFERREGQLHVLHRHKGYERSGVGRQQHCCRHVWHHDYHTGRGWVDVHVVPCNGVKYWSWNIMIMAYYYYYYYYYCLAVVCLKDRPLLLCPPLTEDIQIIWSLLLIWLFRLSHSFMFFWFHFL